MVSACAAAAQLEPPLSPTLGKFVTALLRTDGTYRVLFKVPPRLRPTHWLPTMPLPMSGSRTGNLFDEDEVARIRSDAARLYADYLIARGLRRQPTGRRNIDALVRAWQSSQQFKATKAITQKGYTHYAGVIQRWAKSVGDPDPSKITVTDVEQFVGQYDDRPQNRYHLRQVLWIVMKQAVRLGWRPDNPVAEVKVKAPKTRVRLWTGSSVEAYAKAAVAAGQPDVAAIIRLEWEIGQRLTDVILFRHAADYNAEEGCFRFWQSKTGAYVTLRVSAKLMEAIAACRRADSIYLFHDAATGRPFRDVNRLSHVFMACRPVTEPHLQLRALRHTCVVEMGRAGSDVPEIVSVTGHSLASAHAMLQTYMPRDSEMAANAQRRRGLI